MIRGCMGAGMVMVALTCSGSFAAPSGPLAVYQVRGSVQVELVDTAGTVGIFLTSDPQSRSVSVPFEGGIQLTAANGMEQAKLGHSPLSLIVAGNDTSVTLDGLQFDFWGDGGDAVNLTMDGVRRVFDLPGDLINSSLDPRGAMRVEAAFVLSTDAAADLGMPQAAGTLLGTVRFVVEDRFVASDEAPVLPSDAPGHGEESQVSERTCANPTTGPDVIVGDLPDIDNYGAVSGTRAYAVGTTSCNMGNQTLQWQSSVNRHPVIGQNLYRLKNGRIQQIGISWLKHGFTALAGNVCCTCTNPGTGSLLGTGCSDPYSAGLNGSQGNLGPRWQVNTTTGYYLYPFTASAAPATIGRRLQVREADLDPAQNPGALYFIEGQYVSADESTFGGLMNDNNNASYRRVNVGAAPNFNLSLQASTQRQRAGILAWFDNDSTVGITNVDSAPDGVHDGRFILAYKATSLGGGSWHYEYALHNLNSGRGGRSFTVPIPTGGVVTNAGFSDTFHHSGDGIGNVTQDGTDWAITIGSSDITWSTAECANNPNGNVLAWGTMYNFWFDCDLPPAKVTTTIGLFRGAGPYAPQPGGTNCGTGSAGVAVASASIPAADCNDNNVADSTDISTGGSEDVNGDGIPDECQLPPVCPGDADGNGSVGIADVAVIVMNWFLTGSTGTLGDLNSDGTRGVDDIAIVVQNWASTCP